MADTIDIPIDNIADAPSAVNATDAPADAPADASVDTAVNKKNTKLTRIKPKGIKSKDTKPKGIAKEEKKRKKARKETYLLYASRVLKELHPGVTLGSKSANIINSFINDFFERIVSEASRLTYRAKKSTISYREIQTAVRLTLPEELANHAVSAGNKALKTYASLS